MKYLFKKFRLSRQIKYYMYIYNKSINGCIDWDVNSVDLFFHREIQKNIRSIFNYYNFAIQCDRCDDSVMIINKYFNEKSLLKINKKNSCRPLYINNLASIDFSYGIDATKKVSIIMAVYNGESLIEDAVKSLLAQTYPNIEIVIVDDGSDDKTYEILNHFVSINKLSIKLIRLDDNNGVYIAKNIGIKEATGDLITFHDADDWAHPQRIEEHLKAHDSSPNVKASISKLVRIRPDGLFFSKHIYPLDRLCMVSLMIDRSIIDELGFFRLNRTGSDTEYFERIKTFSKYKVARIDKVLTFCAHRPNSLTTDPKTGISGFGENPKRVHYMNRWQQWHQKMLKAEKKPYVIFDEAKYSYSLDDKVKL